jgi:hypothetical protein
LITDPNLLNSNWTNDGILYAGQNDYNWAFANASDQYDVPTWVLKAIAAHEASFNPSATNGIRAVGLSGMTGNGVSFVIENIDEHDNYFTGQIGDIYNWLTAPTMYPRTLSSDLALKDGETYIHWYARVLQEGKAKEKEDGTCPDLNVDASDEALACNLAWQTRSKFIEKIDGRDSNIPALELPPGDTLNAEIQDNVTISAAHFSMAQQRVFLTVKNNAGEQVWSRLSEKDRVLLTLAVYNTGESSKTLEIIEQAINQGSKPEWTVIKPLMLEAGLLGTVTYAEDIFTHAEQGGN